MEFAIVADHRFIVKYPRLVSTTETSNYQLATSPAFHLPPTLSLLLSLHSPEGFPDILRAYAKSLLKDKPKDTSSYSYEYFMNAIEQANIEKELQEEKEKEAQEGGGEA